MTTATEDQKIKFTAVVGSENAKASETLLTGRQVGKTPRKDITLSVAIKPASAETITMLDSSKLAILLSDATKDYIRTVKLQRMELNDSIELTFNYETMLNILTSAQQRSKKLVSTASIRALLADVIFINARNIVVAKEKQETFNRLSREFMPLCYAGEPIIDTARSNARDIFVLRTCEIAATMKEGCEQRVLLTAAMEILAQVAVTDLSDAV
jgi:hypothetical protein